jgi:hypothetical protein
MWTVNRKARTMANDQISQAAVHAYDVAWEAERNKIGRGRAPKGTKIRAGLAAAAPHLKAELAAENQLLATTQEQMAREIVDSLRLLGVADPQGDDHLPTLLAARLISLAGDTNE